MLVNCVCVCIVQAQKHMCGDVSGGVQGEGGSDAVWMGREFQTASHVIMYGSHVLELRMQTSVLINPQPLGLRVTCA